MFKMCFVWEDLELTSFRKMSRPLLFHFWCKEKFLDDTESLIEITESLLEEQGYFASFEMSKWFIDNLCADDI